MNNMCRIKIDDLNRARDCVQWMIKHIGPQLPGNPGTVVRGEGWSFWSEVGDPDVQYIIHIELNEHVDPETATLFMLKWS